LELSRIGFHYIAGITKPQIETGLEVRAVVESSACRTSTFFARQRAGAGCRIVQKNEIAI
jgi:hypothetical protein